MDVILGHFDLKMIGSQIDAFADGAEVGPRRAFELRLKSGSRTPWPSWAPSSVGITARTRGYLRRSGRAARGAGRHAPGAATDGPRWHHMAHWSRWGTGGSIPRRTAYSVWEVKI